MSDYQDEHPEEVEAAVQAIQDLAAKRAWLAAEVPGIDYSTASTEVIERVYSVFQAGKAESEAAVQAACAICDQGFSAEDWDDRHSDAEGEDVHAACCEASGPCSRESLTNAQAEYAALIDEQEAIEADAAEQERLDDEAAPWHVLGYHQGLGTSVLTFLCEDPTGAEHLVGVDHRPGNDLLAALHTGEDVYIERPEAWQVLAHIHNEVQA